MPRRETHQPGAPGRSRPSLREPRRAPDPVGSGADLKVIVIAVQGVKECDIGSVNVPPTVIKYLPSALVRLPRIVAGCDKKLHEWTTKKSLSRVWAGRCC